MDPTLANDVGANVSGIYDLVAVLTHAGRTADAGHYMAWVKKDGSDDDWWKFDDDKVAPVKKDEIEKLDGGGDWHSGASLFPSFFVRGVRLVRIPSTLAPIIIGTITGVL